MQYVCGPSTSFFPVGVALKCRLTNKSAPRRFASAGRSGQFDFRVTVARQDDVEPGLLELVPQFQRQRQRVGLLAVPERVVARVLAAMPRIKANGR